MLSTGITKYLIQNTENTQFNFYIYPFSLLLSVTFSNCLPINQTNVLFPTQASFREIFATTFLKEPSVIKFVAPESCVS